MRGNPGRTDASRRILAFVLLPSLIVVVIALAARFHAGGDRGGAIPRGVHLMPIGDNGGAVSVVWHTQSRLARPTVRYQAGVGDTADESARPAHSMIQVEAKEFRYAGSSTWHYRADVSELSRGTQYSFSVGGADGPRSEPQRFSTAPLSGAPFTFAVFGDSRQSKKHRNSPIRRRLAAAVAAESPRFAIFTGDMVDDGSSYSEWDQWFEDFSPVLKKIPLVPVFGNHEAKESKHEVVYYRFFPLPEGMRWTSFDYGSVHFAVLNTEIPYSESPWSLWREQARWFERDMAMAARRPHIAWRIVVCHKPPYTTGHHSVEKDSKDIQRHLPPLLDRAEVDLVFSAHDHYYQRSFPIRGGRVVDRAPAVYRNPRGVIYVVTAGAGAPLSYGEPAPWVAVYREAYHHCMVRVESAVEIGITVTDIDGARIERVRIVKSAR